MKSANEKYEEEFKGKKREQALDRAWANRDFEINLFWKRASFFWVFITLSYTGSFALFLSKEHRGALYIASISILLSFIWYLVQKASKKWQENWEAHIDILEDDVEGPIYKYVIIEPSHSVTKLSMAISILNIVFSISLFALCYVVGNISTCYMIVAISILLVIITLIFFLTKTNTKKKEIEFFRRDSSLKK